MNESQMLWWPHAKDVSNHAFWVRRAACSSFEQTVKFTKQTTSKPSGTKKQTQSPVEQSDRTFFHRETYLNKIPVLILYIKSTHSRPHKYTQMQAYVVKYKEPFVILSVWYVYLLLINFLEIIYFYTLKNNNCWTNLKLKPLKNCSFNTSTHTYYAV